MTRELLEWVSEREDLADLDPAERRLALRSVVADRGGALADVVGRLSDWIDGYGPLSPLMSDPEVTDVLVNGPDEVWVERRGHLERTSVAFEDRDELMDLIERLLGAAGGRVDAAHPIADVRLGDGSRAHVVLPPLSGSHPALSIRRFPAQAFSLTDLAERRFITPAQQDLLQRAVADRATIAIGGGTGAGKTTLANALLGCIGPDERVVVIEETPELRPVCPHWVSLIARPPNIEGKGAVDQAELLRAALRMRPDRIVVGEVRGAEALVALQAMATGHEGSMVTVHARSADEVCERLVDLASMSERSPSEEGLRRRVHSSIGLVVQVARVKGVRRVVEILRP